MSPLRDDTDRLYKALTTAMEARELRPDLVDGPDGPECAWAAYERYIMHVTVCSLQGARGLPLASLEEIITAERQAAGHSDYARKFALYCAELVQHGSGGLRTPEQMLAARLRRVNRPEGQEHREDLAQRLERLGTRLTAVNGSRGGEWDTELRQEWFELARAARIAIWGHNGGDTP